MATFQSESVKNGNHYFGTAQPGMVMCRSGKISGTFAANDVLEMVPVPKGAMILDVQLVNPALASSSTLNVGDAADPDRYFAALSASAAGSHASANAGAATAHGVVYPEDTVVTVTNLTAQSDEKELVVHVFYKMVEGHLPDEADAFPPITL